jgi:hypothetical protein
MHIAFIGMAPNGLLITAMGDMSRMRPSESSLLSFLIGRVTGFGSRQAAMNAKRKDQKASKCEAVLDSVVGPTTERAFLPNLTIR